MRNQPNLKGILLSACLISVFAIVAAAPALAAEGHAFTGSFEGKPGTELKAPWGIDVDGPAGTVLVADSENHQVAKFNLKGEPEDFSSLGSNELKGKGAPEEFGELPFVTDVPGGGDVYASDYTHNVVDAFTAAGVYVGQITGAGSPAGSLATPFAVAVAPSGDVWVIDNGHDVVDEFQPEEGGKKFKYLTQIDVAGLGEPLSNPQDVAVDSAGNVYVAGNNEAAGHFQVDKFKPEGVFEDVFDPNGGTSVAVDTSSTPNDVYVLEQNAQGEGGKLISELESTSATGFPFEQFHAPAGTSLEDIAVASTTHTVYATNYHESKVEIATVGETPKEAPKTEPASGETTSEATLHGELDPIGAGKGALEYQFDYNKGASCLGGPSIPVPAGEVAEAKKAVVQGEVTGLQPNTKYTYCLLAYNAFGFTRGNEVAFTTLGTPPVISSDSASAVTAFDAQLTASIDPENEETGYSFEYSTKASGEPLVLEGPITTVKGAPPAALLPAVFEERTAGPVDLGGTLLPGTTYFFRGVAENQASKEAGEPAYGPVESFTTPAATPVLSAGHGEGITATTATLTATVNPQGAATSYHVRYIPQAGYEAALAAGAPDPYALGRNTREGELPAGNTPVAVSLLAEELTPGTTYEIELVASNIAGSESGPTTTFTTEQGPPQPTPPAEPEALNPPPGPSPFTATTLPAVIPFQTIAELNAKEAKEDKGVPNIAGPTPKKAKCPKGKKREHGRCVRVKAGKRGKGKG